MRAEFEAELLQLITVGTGDQRVTTTKARLVIKSIVAAAITGNMAAAKLALDAMKLQPLQEDAADHLAANDRELLRKFLDSELAKRNAPPEQVS